MCGISGYIGKKKISSKAINSTILIMKNRGPDYQDYWTKRFEDIKAKTLVMTGEGDVGSTPEMSNNLSKKIKNSIVKIIPVGKHLCSIECSDDVNSNLKDHILNA